MPPHRHARPREQAALGLGHRQTSLGKPVTHHFKTMLILHSQQLHRALIGFQRHRTGLLNNAGSQHRSLPVYGFDGREDFGVARHESTAPAGHHIHLGQRAKFQRHVQRARSLQQAQRAHVAEFEPRIGEIVKYDESVLLGQAHGRLIQFGCCGRAGRIVGIVQNQQFGASP